MATAQLVFGELGGGGGGVETEVCGYSYVPSYFFAIVNTKTGVVSSAELGYAIGTGTQSLTASLMKVEVVGSHTFKWTALNGAYLYRVGVQDTDNITGYGQNGTFTSGNDTYQKSYTMIATKQPLF